MLLGKVALVGTLQNQLEDVGEKLAKSERMLLEHEKNVKAEKTRAVEVEKQMKVAGKIGKMYLFAKLTCPEYWKRSLLGS